MIYVTYKPPYEISKRMLNQIDSIMKLVRQFVARIQLDKHPKLRRTNKVKSIYSCLFRRLSKEYFNRILDRC